MTGLLSRRLFDGRWGSLAGFLTFGVLVLVFLFATVHRRDLSLHQSGSKPTAAWLSERYVNLIRLWIEHGYLKHGGLWFLQPGDVGYIDAKHPRIYRSGGMGFLQVAHVVQRINYAVRGKVSHTLMVVHNQAWVWLSSALLGLLGMRLARRLGTVPLHALLLGVGAAVVYQTFPINLWYYWEIVPTGVVSTLAVLFLLLEEIAFDAQRLASWLAATRAVCVFSLVWAEPVSAVLFLLGYVAAAGLLAPASLRRYSPVKTLIVPAGVALAVFGLQLLFARLNYPQMQLFGGTFMFRTGLDGSAQYYRDHLDLVATHARFPFSTHLAPLVQWWFLFLAGTFALLAVVGLRLTRLPNLMCAVAILATALGLYFPYVFIFSQAAVIHPYGYDVYVAIPLTLALFAVLPASLECLTKHAGVFTLLALGLAVCYSMVQLRTYAAAFPLPSAPSGW